MANPQKERGYVAIANELWDAWCAFGSPDDRVFKAIIRLTWGWNRKSAAITHKQIEELTGISNHGFISRITKRLVDCGMIAKSSSWGRVTEYTPNKDYEQWTIAPQVSTAPTCSTAREVLVSTAPTCNGSTAPTCNSDEVDTLLHENHVNHVKPVSTLHPLVEAYIAVFSARLTDSVLLDASSKFESLEALDCYDEDTAKVIMKRWAQYELPSWQKQPENSGWSQPSPKFFVAVVRRYLESGQMPGPKPAKTARVECGPNQFIWVEPSDGSRWVVDRIHKSFLESCYDLPLRMQELSGGLRPIGRRIEEVAG